MPPAKRKRSSSSPPPRKKSTTSKSKSKSKQKPIYVGEEDVYEVKEILESDGENYKVDWEPNAVTGEVYDPEWIPKGNVTEDLREAWEAINGAGSPVVKASKRGRPTGSKKWKGKQSQSVIPAAIEGGIESSEEDNTDLVQKKRRRLSTQKRIIESSPAPSEENAQARAKTSNSEEGSPLITRSGSLSHTLPINSTEGAASRPAVPSPRSLKRKVVIIPTALSPEAKATYLPESSPPFSSSQVISGTAPQLEGGSQPQPHFVDAAAATNLTQAHSQYQQVDTSKSTNDTTGSLVATTSSSNNPDSAPENLQGPIVPDSQSLGDSLSYVPTTQEASGATSGENASEDQISHTGSSQTSEVQNVPESSIVQATTQSGNSTQSVIAVAAPNLPFIEDDSSSDEGDLDDRATPAQASPAPRSNHSAISISSTSSPPPTESPDKSQTDSSRFASQIQSQTQQLEQSQAQLPEQSQAQQLEQSLQASAEQSHRAAQRQNQALAKSLDSPDQALPPQLSDDSFLPLVSPSEEVHAQASHLTSSTESASSQGNILGHAFQSLVTEKDKGPRTHSSFSPETPIFYSAPNFEHNRAPTELTSVSRTESSRFLTQIQGVQAQPTTPIASRSSQEEQSLSPIEQLEQFRQDLVTKTKNDSPEDSMSQSRSSLVDRVPSQGPDTLRSAPPRPETPSDLPSTPAAAMTQQLTAPSPAWEKLRELQERGRKSTEDIKAEIAASRLRSSMRANSRFSSPARDGRSPSAVPAAKSRPIPTAEEDRTSEKYPTLVPELPATTSGLRRASTSVLVGSTMQVQQDQHEVLNQFVVPIIFSSQQRDQYKQTIMRGRADFEPFEANLWPESSEEYAKAAGLIEQLRQVTQHPDLVNEETFTQAQADPHVKADWDRICSAKFRFMHQLLDQLRERDLHVVVEYKDRRLGQIFDTFLTGNDIRHKQASTSQDFEGTSALAVTLCQNDDTSDLKADLYIILDCYLSLTSPHRRAVRTRKDGTLAPLLMLVVPNSVEHIEHCLPEVSPAHRMSILCCTVTLNRTNAGRRLDAQLTDVKESAMSISQYIQDGGKAEDWPLGKLTDVALEEPTVSAETSSGENSTQVSLDAATGLKRTRVSTLFLKHDQRLTPIL